MGLRTSERGALLTSADASASSSNNGSASTVLVSDMPTLASALHRGRCLPDRGRPNQQIHLQVGMMHISRQPGLLRNAAIDPARHARHARHRRAVAADCSVSCAPSL